MISSESSGILKIQNTTFSKYKLWGIIFLIISIFLFGMYFQDTIEIINKTRIENSEQQEERYIYLCCTCVFFLLSLGTFYLTRKTKQ